MEKNDIPRGVFRSASFAFQYRRICASEIFRALASGLPASSCSSFFVTAGFACSCVRMGIGFAFAFSSCSCSCSSSTITSSTTSVTAGFSSCSWTRIVALVSALASASASASAFWSLAEVAIVDGFVTRLLLNVSELWRWDGLAAVAVALLAAVERVDRPPRGAMVLDFKGAVVFLMKWLFLEDGVVNVILVMEMIFEACCWGDVCQPLNLDVRVTDNSRFLSGMMSTGSSILITVPCCWYTWLVEILGLFALCS